jgi:hypothetical protein
MKSFRGYLKNSQDQLLSEAPAWTESLSTMLFDLPRADLKDVKIPLSPSIFKRIWPEPVRSRVFHLTDLDGLGKLKGMQGGKRSVSAFYNINSSSIGDGIQTHGGYIAEMDADVLAAAPDDIGSQPDKQGRRWLVWSTLVDPKTQNGMGGKSQLGGMYRDINEMMIEIIMEYADDPSDFLPNTNEAWMSLGLYSSPKEKSLIIKDYMDGMEKIMKKHSKPLKSLFTDYAFDKELMQDPDSGDFALWDEVVVNNFKIKKVHVTEEFGEDWQDDDDIEGFPFELYTDNGDLADYITRTKN